MKMHNLVAGTGTSDPIFGHMLESFGEVQSALP